MGEIVDPSLKKQMSLDLVHEFSTIAYECLHEDRELRPPMHLVVKRLEKLLAVQTSLFKLPTDSSRLKATKIALSDGIKPAHSSVREGGYASKIPLDISVLCHMREFVKYDRLKQFALRALANEFDEEELCYLKDQFDAIDVDQSGAITLEEMRDALAKNLPWRLKETRVLEILYAIDSNEDGLVDFTEFVAATLHVHQLEEHNPEKWQHLSQAAFEKFDVDRDGYITPEDIKMHTGLKAGSIEVILEEADIDKDCKISLPEFRRMLRS
ncbi:calcium-dependent protein kinase 28-like [Bidens hawaiensis]|uniref:calcium-dependent protein kinase 28-like n=1 Tax=Bidens hawaiensis TaxID=980011 RepID=UPI004049107B